MLAYEVAGQGPPILLLHAFPLSHAMWKDQIAPLAQLGRVIAPDLPGLGRSARQVNPSIADMAAAIAGVLDALTVQEPVVVAGLSMGGYVAFELWRQFPSRVRALGLFSTRAGADTPEQRAGRQRLAEQVRREGVEPVIQTIMPKLLGKATLASQPMVVEAVQWLILANKPNGVADALLAMEARQDSTPLLPSISVPTLLLAGDEDTIVSSEDWEAMKQAIPHAKLERLDKAGHLLNLEQPAEFLGAFRRFLKDVLPR